MEAARTPVVQRALRLERLTVLWNSLEGLIAITSGIVAGSVALIGFGFDSVIEVSSGVVLLWRLHADHDVKRRERIELRALRLVGLSFFLLAAYVAYDALHALLRNEPPEASYTGIVLAALSLIVMPALARAKRRAAAAMKSRALEADSRQTEICAYLSAVLLSGLILNAAFGWWWSDPVAGLAMTPIIAKEGWDAFRGDPCCD